MAKPHREIPPWTTGAFYTKGVQAVLLERYESVPGWPVDAFRATEDLAGAAETNWSHGDGFLRCYVEDRNWTARLLVEVTKHITEPRDQWTQERWISEEWVEVGRPCPEPLAVIVDPNKPVVNRPDPPRPVWKELHDHLNAVVGWPFPGLSVAGLRTKAAKISAYRREVDAKWARHFNASR